MVINLYVARLALLILFILSFGNCGPTENKPIIVFGSPDSPRLRQAAAGVKAAVNAGPLEVVMVPQFGPQGQETLRRLRQTKPRLLVVLGTPALLWVAPVVKQVPVVFGLVANPYFTRAAYDPAHPEIHQENVTGIASPAPLAAALQHGVSLLGQGAWGLLYDPSDGVAVDLARRFEAKAQRLGVQTLTETSMAAATDQDALGRLLQRGARVLYLSPAPSTARYAPLALDWGRQMKVRVVSGLPEDTPKGAVLRVALDYRRLGEEIGGLARRVLAGEKPRDLPIMEQTPLTVEVDETLARKWSGYPPGNHLRNQGNTEKKGKP
jgi:ABC-type uncharacterized transport system substrate-binding protein